MDAAERECLGGLVHSISQALVGCKNVNGVVILLQSASELLLRPVEHDDDGIKQDDETVHQAAEQFLALIAQRQISQEVVQEALYAGPFQELADALLTCMGSLTVLHTNLR